MELGNQYMYMYSGYNLILFFFATKECVITPDRYADNVIDSYNKQPHILQIHRR